MQRSQWLSTVVAVLGVLLLAGHFAAAGAAEKKVQIVVPGCSS